MPTRSPYRRISAPASVSEHHIGKPRVHAAGLVRAVDDDLVARGDGDRIVDRDDGAHLRVVAHELELTARARRIADPHRGRARAGLRLALADDDALEVLGGVGGARGEDREIDAAAPGAR